MACVIKGCKSHSSRKENDDKDLTFHRNLHDDFEGVRTHGTLPPGYVLAYQTRGIKPVAAGAGRYEIKGQVPEVDHRLLKLLELMQKVYRDKIYDEHTSTRDVYNDIAKPIVEAATAGINGTIFAYGQTSSGKTYIMSGTDEDPGIIPQTVYDLFDIIKKKKEDRHFLLRVSYIEIYNETIKDLLNVKKEKIKIRESVHEGVKVDATEKITSSPEEVLDIMKEGETNRQIGCTNMNEKSSRSHSIFQITIESREHDASNDGCVNVSTLNLVDLAGSERAGQTGATGIRFTEGTHINKSLSALALVIKQLSEDHCKFANYRDSKLTRVLQNSLGGNAKTSIICAVTPAALEETISTLQFANRAKAIKNKPEVNAVADDASMITKLTKRLSKLQSELENKRNLEQNNRMLTKKIEALQRQILNGFGQCGTIDKSRMDRRRTWAAPRRMTIDTLHTIDEDAETSLAVPRFCTPALKYNPAMFNVDFLPIQSDTIKTAPVSEETAGHVTPPLGKNVNFSDDVVEIESDNDDDSTDAQLCSPYHKCFVTTKTPPCVLRDKAKTAQKNLNDIVELTEREKMYTPTVVELLEKLEENTSVIADLQDNLTKLNTECIKKDSEIKSLKNNVTKAQEDMKAVIAKKADLESLYKESLTKLTDLEVIYESFKKKAKTRENELLSYLEERRIIVTKQSGVSKLEDKEVINLMDLSKDISLENSDSESENENSSKLYEKIADLQSQLNLKNSMVDELEEKLNSEKIKIDELETTNKDLQGMLASLSLKFNESEEKNSLLKLTVENLKSTIQSQKHNLDSATNNIESNYKLIQELQQKLNEKNVKINILEDSALEELIANEEKIIANNDNLKNIIYSLRSVIDARNKEIIRLTLENSSNDSYKTEVEMKEKQINNLVEELEKVREKLNENAKNMALLTNFNDTFMETKSNLVDQVESLKNQNEILEIKNRDHIHVIEQLNEDKEELALTVSETEIREKEVASKTEALALQLETVHCALNALEDDIKQKSNIISSLTKDNAEYISKLNEVTNRIEIVLTKLSGQIIEKKGSENINSTLNLLEKAALDIIALNDLTSKANSHLETELRTIKEKHHHEIIELQAKISYLTELNSTSSDLNAILTQQVENLLKNIDNTRQEIKDKIKESTEFEKKMQDALTECQMIRKHLEDREKEIATLKDNEIQLNREAENVKTLLKDREETYNSLIEEIQEINATYLRKISSERINRIMSDKDTDIANLTASLSNVEITLPNKYAEIIKHAQIMSEGIIYKEQILQSILDKVTDLTNNFNVEKSLICGAEDEVIETYEQIPNMLAKIGVHIDVLAQKVNDRAEDQFTALENALSEAKTEIKELTTSNLKLTSDIAQQEERYRRTLSEMDAIENENKVLSISLDESKRLLESSNEEITRKVIEIKRLENDAEKIKKEFCSTESYIRQEINNLEVENSVLRKKCAELEEHIPNQKIKPMQDFEDSAFKASSVRNSLSNILEKTELNMPQSLISICCSKIIEALNANDVDKSTTPSSSSSQTDVAHIAVQAEICQCNAMSTELVEMHKKNETLKQTLQFLKLANKKLIEEQEEIHAEVNLLVEPATDLHKKIIKHRTNLSTLTATTYAENKALQSQVKFLQHHQRRFHNVCQKDIPQFKNQLMELYNILKAESLIGDVHNNIIKRYSLPDVLDKNTPVAAFKNDSTLDGDLLMLDNSVTLASSCDHTLVGNDQTCFDITQTYLEDTTEIEPHVSVHLETLAIDNLKLSQTMKVLIEENRRLKDQVEKVYSFKNESKLIGKHLVLDVKDTLPIFGDNTLLGHDETGATEIVPYDHQKLSGSMEILKDGNRKMEEQVEKLKIPLATTTSKVDAQNSPIKTTNNFSESLTHLNESICENCKDKNEVIARLDELSRELSLVNNQKEELEEKYNDLSLEIPSSEALVRKLGVLEKEQTCKTVEVTNLTNDLSKKNRLIKQLQEENETLSTQVMDNISEADDLKKQLDILKEGNTKLLEKCNLLEQSIQGSALKASETCPQCLAREKLSQNHTSDSNLWNRSQRDIDTSLRCNTIYTLQNELHASREDCKKITEEVATIKNHLERSNLSISQGMDDSMAEPNIFTFTRDFDAIDTHASRNFTASMPNILEERSPDIYAIDKTECLNYYVEKTGAEKENFNHDDLHEVKIIEVMKLLYNNLITKHGNEVQNLRNQLISFEESKSKLQSEIDSISSEYSNVCHELEEKGNGINSITRIRDFVKNNVNAITEEVSNKTENYKNGQLVIKYKENILEVLDKELSLNITPVFEFLIESISTKHQNDISSTMDSYAQLQQHMETLMSELTNVKEDLIQMKEQLSHKENDYILLKAQKERVHEISNAVTLDIVKKEQELSKTIHRGCQMLLENNIMNQEDIDLSLPSIKSVTMLFETLVSKQKANDKIQQTDLENEKEKLFEECTNLKNLLNDKETELVTLSSQNDKVKEINKAITLDLVQKENDLEKQRSLHDDLRKDFENKMSEHNENICLMQNMRQEIAVLQESFAKKEATLQTLECEITTLRSNNQDNQIAELIGKTKNLEAEFNDLKSINAMITKENEIYKGELQKCGDIIRQKTDALEKMEADVLILTESVKETTRQLESVSSELEKMKEQNNVLKNDNAAISVKVNEVQQNYEEKCREIIRMEKNIKTHEKTVQIQSSMVKRLQKQKDDDINRIEELTNKCASLENEFQILQATLTTRREEILSLQNQKDNLETRVSDLETQLEATHKGRLSMDAINTNSRRRRQSLHDSKRMSGEFPREFDDNNKIELMFATRHTLSKPEDLFMDVDDNSSNRSTPARNSSDQRRESPFARMDQSAREEDVPSRPGSVQAARLRRQSIHDLHRSVGHTPSPRESLLATRLAEDPNVLSDGTNESEMATLKATLSSCQQELEELKERFRELDEECETCAEYLRERDEQCQRLWKEKVALEKTVAELKETLEKSSPNLSENTETKRDFASVAVNTDEDWTNLHSVVVDRMSFDREVEKNKNLTNTLEKYRLRDREHKAQISKMQRVIDKSAAKDGSPTLVALEAKNQELEAVKQELKQLQERYQELDEECETCAEYLRERDEQCSKLKADNKLLQTKLEALEKGKEESLDIVKSGRKKRQSLHDLNRDNQSPIVDATTETSAEVLTSQDDSSRMLDGDAANIKRLTMMVDRLTREKQAMEQQLASAPVYVGTGSAIVQNQKISDLMKENQKLRKQNVKLVNYFKKRGKSCPDMDQENNDTAEQA